MAKRPVVEFGVYSSGGAAKTGWKVLDVQLGVDGAYGEAAVTVPDSLLEEWDSDFDPDTRLFVKRGSTVVLKGRPLKPVIQWGSNFEGISATILGAEWDLDRHHVWGQLATAAGEAGSTLIFSGIETVFNPSGIGNKEAGQRVFQPDPAAPDRELWSVKEIVLYLLERVDEDIEEDLVDRDGIAWPDEVDSHYVFGLKVQGMTYREALTAVLSRAGYSWALTPKDDLTVEHDLTLFRRGDDTGATAKQVYLPAHGGSVASISSSDREKATPEGVVNLDHAGVATEVIGYGGVKVYETTFTLRKGWSAEDEAAVFAGGSTAAQVGAFRRLCTRDNDSFDTYRNIGRRYILNETGREDTNPESEEWDFSTLFGGKHTPRSRPFLPHRMTKDDHGNYLPPKVLVDDVVYGGGSGSPEGEYSWVLLEGIAGIFFNSEKVPYDEAKALRDDDYTAGFPSSVKIIAAVESDVAVSASHESGTTAITTTVVRVFDLQSKYTWDNVSGVAESTDLLTYVENKGKQLGQRQDVGRLLVNEIVSGFDVGDWIDEISGRAIALHAQVVGLRWGVDEQVTEIFLESMEADALSERAIQTSAPSAVPTERQAASTMYHEAPTKGQIEAYNEYMRRRGINVR